MFVRVYDDSSEIPEAKRRELLINVATISMIEVSYVIPSKSGPRPVPIGKGLEQAGAIRLYRFSAGGEEHTIAAQPGDPVAGVFDRIYANALKGIESGE